MTTKIDLRHGDCLEVMAEMPENSIDTIITDPPYGLEFMGKDWDHGVPGTPFWEAALRVAKPGTTLLAFGGTRTHHRLMVAIEDAGWEIRDCMMWLYGSGFPSGNHNISKAIDKAAGAERVKTVFRKDGRGKWDTKMERESGDTGVGHANGSHQQYWETRPATPEAEEWDGWGTLLKPSWEPVIVARKRCDGTLVNNALKWKVAGLWIDGARVPTDDKLIHGGSLRVNTGDARTGKALGMFQDNTPNTYEQHPGGRWPANLVHDGSIEVVELFPQTKEGSTSRFFYCAKAPKREKWFYCSICDDAYPIKEVDDHAHDLPPRQRKHIIRHPTQKPVSLMEYLCKLTRTPTGGVVLDPFMGSGSTGEACINTDRDFIGIDIEYPSYVTAMRRLEVEEPEPEPEPEPPQEGDSPQLDFFSFVEGS